MGLHQPRAPVISRHGFWRGVTHRLSHSYSSYGYGSTYVVAASGDYAYRLDHSGTEERADFESAISRLTLGSGSYDDPEDYARILYESYADVAVDWRPGASHFLLILCDSIPHDDNLNEGVHGKIGNLLTEGDPGRDEVMFTSDDLDLQTVLSQMVANNVVLLVIRYGYLVTATTPHWQHWANLTGGEMYTTSNMNGIPAKIESMAQTPIPEIGPKSLLILAGFLTAVLVALKKRARKFLQNSVLHVCSGGACVHIEVSMRANLR